MEQIKCLMLVEDDETDILLVTKSLELHGIAKNILVARHGIEALKNLSEYFELNKTIPDVFLIDLRMPLMDGFDLIKNIMKLPFFSSDSKIIAISASMDDESNQKRIESLGVRRFMTKPFEIHNFQKNIA